MSVRRSPSKPDNLMKTPPPLCYGSDSAINTSSIDKPCHFKNNSKRQKRTLDDFTSSPVTDFTEIKSMFADFKSQQDEKFEALNSALNIIMHQNEGIQKTVEHMNSQYEELLLRTNSLEDENHECKKRISGLESKLEYLEKLQRSSTVEIRNIPLQKHESKDVFTKVVQDIGVALGLDSTIQTSEIRDIYRAKRGAVVVDFTCTRRKEAVIVAYKNLQKTRRANKELPFNTSQILPGGPPTNIFISEFLTTKASHLYYLARENVKSKKIFSTWVSYGTIFVKKEEGMTPTRIDTEEDLLKIVSQ